MSKDWGVYDSAGNGGVGKRRPSQVTVADGRMTQTGTFNAVTGGMVLDHHSYRYGRWEARIRTSTQGRGRAYHAVTALIPGDGAPYHCGATDIDFAEYDIGQPVFLYAHNRPNRQDYLSQRLSSTAWHTFAVEIGPTHLSWFVDGRIVASDNTSRIVSGVALAPNFQLDAYHLQGLAPSKLQVDWIRYYPLRGNSGPHVAPKPEQGTYVSAC